MIKLICIQGPCSIALAYVDSSTENMNINTLDLCYKYSFLWCRGSDLSHNATVSS